MDDQRIIDLEGVCLESMPITNWHFREAIHTSPGHKCLTFQADWLWIKRRGAVSQVLTPPSALTLIFQDPAPPFFFSQMKEFLDDMKISMSLFWFKYVSMWLLPWYKFLGLVLCSGSKIFFSNEESLLYLLPPTTRIGWVTNSMAAKICRKRNWNLMRLACVKPIFKW